MDRDKKNTIVLVEDDLGHAKLIMKNLKRSGINNPIAHLKDGQEAIDYLFCTGEYEGNKSPKPLLMLLDLNMPVLDGMQVLKIVKENEKLRSIPIIVLTTTGSDEEVERCYDLGCNVFIKKPVDYTDFCDAVKKLGMFLEVMIVPSGN